LCVAINFNFIIKVYITIECRQTKAEIQDPKEAHDTSNKKMKKKRKNGQEEADENLSKKKLCAMIP